jgi:hypothetical protein
MISLAIIADLTRWPFSKCSQWVIEGKIAEINAQN